ncbi:MAG: A/G-specific adenine glycosylase [Pseudomonadota bacterium]
MPSLKKNTVKNSRLSIEDFQATVLYWYDWHGRKSLPWQQQKNPYRVWLSEVMLQQTQVTTVIPYFERFIATFPDLQSLALAPEESVLHLWTGLGYYTRARNLHKAARIIHDSLNHNFPDNLEDLQKLPGIGRSTAGAILAIAFEKKAAILDGNVKRFLTRLHGITAWPGEKSVSEELWRLAEMYTPDHRIADYTQAVMDIGATLCVRGQPRCGDCPFEKNCGARQLGLEKQLPQKKPSKVLPVRTVTLLVMHDGSQVLLEKRPATGVWGSLWSLPEISGLATAEEIRVACRQRYGQTLAEVTLAKSFRHTFSHFHLDILPAMITVRVSKRKIMAAEEKIWYNLQQPAALGMPAPIKNLLQKLTEDKQLCLV